MVSIDYPLERLQDSISRFVVPSAAFLDMHALRAQIELRQRALMDIEVIRTRLRLWNGRAAVGLPGRRKGAPGRKASLSRLRRNRVFTRPV